MKKLLAALLLTLATPAGAAHYDVVVVGAGTGGFAAALQASRMGASVALIEPTHWVGGQMTAAGVTTLDDLTRNRSGIYEEFMNRLRRTYKDQGKNFAICYWGGDGTSGAADVQDHILRSMLEEGGVHLFESTTVVNLLKEEGKVTGVIAQGPEGREEFTSTITIDATELGDLMPLFGGRYRVGKSISPNLNPNDQLQDITWVMPIARLPQIAPSLQAPKPFDYSAMVHRHFRPVVISEGNQWGKGGYPYDLKSFNAYRAYPDLSNDAKIKGDNPKTWHLITATSLNWGNDYPGRGDDKKGLKAKYLLDEGYRRQANRGALMRTLGLLRYYQTELGQRDWTVDTRLGYALRGDDPMTQVDALPDWALEFARHMPPIPYARESRRLVGLHTLVADEIYRNVKWDRARHRFSTAIAVGEYPIDVHGSRRDDGLEADLGESRADFPPRWHAGRFQVPLEVLIPEKVDGFLAAEKNISVSRLVNGATRLHPITMHTGQAAGALAALSVQLGLQPRDVPPFLVQQQLLQSGCMLALSFFKDAPRGSDDYLFAQYAAIAALDPISKNYFGSTLPLSTRHLAQVIERLGGVAPTYANQWATSSQVVSAVEQITGLRGLELPQSEEVTRLQFARLLYEAKSKEAQLALPKP